MHARATPEPLRPLIASGILSGVDVGHQKIVSVIIPVYNIERYLAATLDSLMAQTYRNLEVLLIDDGSTDASGAICIEYAQKYPVMRYIRQQNRGVSAARNRGIREATGDYLMFLDSDDFFEPDMIEACFRANAGHNADVVIFGMFFDTVKNGKLKSRTVRSHEDAVVTRETFKDRYWDLFRANYLTPTWNKLYKRSVVADHKLSFDEKLSNFEDLLFTLDCLAHVDKAVIVSRPYYHYCKRERQSLSRI